ncbi:hypothetical protein [Actinocorallia aurea]
MESADFTGGPSVGFVPDTVITAGPPRAPYHCVIVEIQRTADDRRRAELARYAASLWLRISRPVHVMVLTPDDKTARYYATPVQTDLPGYTFQAHPVGPSAIPLITDPAEAAVHLELAMFSVRAHAEQHPETLRAFLEGLGTFPAEKRAAYAEYCWNISTDPATRAAIEAFTKNTAEHPLPAEAHAARRTVVQDAAAH